MAIPVVNKDNTRK